MSRTFSKEYRQIHRYRTLRTAVKPLLTAPVLCYSRDTGRSDQCYSGSRILESSRWTTSTGPTARTFSRSLPNSCACVRDYTVRRSNAVEEIRFSSTVTIQLFSGLLLRVGRRTSSNPFHR